MENKTVDNYECASVIDEFRQRYFDPLNERVKKNFEYIFEGGYEKHCKDENVDPDEKAIEKMKKGYDDLFFQYNEIKKVLEACSKLVDRHEHVTEVLAKIYVGIRDNILWEGEVPKNLMKEQADMLMEYFLIIKKILEPIKPDAL